MNGQPVHQIVAMALVFALTACVDEQTLRPDSASIRVADEPGHRRGILECEEDRPCGAPWRSTVDILQAPVSANDVAIQFLKVGADGRQWPLPNGSALAPGEKFAIRIEANRDAHVYLWHRDPQGRLTELLGTSGLLGSRDCGRSNRLRAGQLVELPAPGAHYTLDARTGTERIQPFVTPHPLCGSGDLQSGWLRAGIESDCPVASGRCGEIFVIHHLKST